MYAELGKCISELSENHTGAEIAGAFSEYWQIVKSVSRDYGGNTTVAELRDEHPELDFMDDEELGEILRQAKVLRRSREDKRLGQKQLKEKKARILREIHSMMDTRTEVEKKAVLAIAEFEYDRASRLIAYLDNDALRGLICQLSEVNKKLWELRGGKDVQTTT